MLVGGRGPVFQYFKDLDPTLNSATILQITDGRRIAAVAPNGDGMFYDGSITNKPNVRIREINDVAMFILEQGDRRAAFDRAREIRPACSPVMKADVRCLNEDGFLGGAVFNADVPFARIWTRTGQEHYASIDANTVITKLGPQGAGLAIGTYGPYAALFNRDRTTFLRGPGGAMATATTLNGAGIIGGHFADGDATHAVIWDDAGLVNPLEIEDENTVTLAVLEDGSVIAKGDSGYWIGRPGEMAVFDSSRLKSVEMFPLVSIDAISPTGIMVVTLEEPTSKRRTRAIVGPEAARRA